MKLFMRICLKFYFSIILRVNKFIFFQPSFILFHSHYKWNNNTYLPLYDNFISFKMWVSFSFFIWNAMNFFFNSIQSSSQCDIEEYHFCVWWILNEIIISFLFIQTRCHMTNIFSLFTTINILPTNHYFQQQWLYCRLPSLTPFHLPTIWSVNHFHLWSHHRHLKIRQMNRLFLSISYLQFIPSWDWRRERESMCKKGVKRWIKMKK
jgi:hypothetical protein